jgi:hypothetical protein
MISPMMSVTRLISRIFAPASRAMTRAGLHPLHGIVDQRLDFLVR